MKCKSKCQSITECNGIDCLGTIEPVSAQPLVYRLRERARIRRQIPNRRSALENKPDRISDLLDEAASEIERLRHQYIGNKSFYEYNTFIDS